MFTTLTKQKEMLYLSEKVFNIDEFLQVLQQ